MLILAFHGVFFPIPFLFRSQMHLRDLSEVVLRYSFLSLTVSHDRERE